jgi:hypothetical protein
MTMAMARPPLEDSQTNTDGGDKFRPEGVQAPISRKNVCSVRRDIDSKKRIAGARRRTSTRLRGGFGGDLRPNELTQTAFAADEYLKARARLLRAQFQPGRPHRSFAGFAYRAIGKDCVLHGHNNVTDRFSRLSYHTLRSPVRFREFPIRRTSAAARLVPPLLGNICCALQQTRTAPAEGYRNAVRCLHVIQPTKLIKEVGMPLLVPILWVGGGALLLGGGYYILHVTHVFH